MVLLVFGEISRGAYLDAETIDIFYYSLSTIALLDKINKKHTVSFIQVRGILNEADALGSESTIIKRYN
ncbi:hypothetical protein PsAD14_04959 [Pseudovibrio sp. Ad14]|nr:hypothetical protein PsW74_04377 [Pseudovibrio sp. W74]KZL04722.1 hypothetical protein PsAD14_04959 [Pseudovibrio sp. Ad14]